MTKIVSITTHPVSLPRPRPVWTAQEEMKAASLILTEIRTDDGLVGYGKINGAPMKRVCEWVARFAEVITGMDALATTEVWERMFALTVPRPDAFAAGPRPFPRGERGQIMAALAGIDIALWDLKGKAAGLPVWRLLGGVKKPIFTYATGAYYRDGATNRDYADEMAGLVDYGYHAVKIKCGAGTVADEAARVAAVRRAIGDTTLLMLDMNAPYDLRDCIDFACAVAPSNVFWLEEPLHWYLQPADYAVLAEASPIPLAHGEREFTRFTIRDFITIGKVRYIQFDATRYAGFTEALRIAHLVDQMGAVLAPHTAPELHAHLVAAFPRCAFGVESHGGPNSDPLAYGVFHDHAELTDGHLELGDKPGFGLDIDWDFVAAHGP